MGIPLKNPRLSAYYKDIKNQNSRFLIFNEIKMLHANKMSRKKRRKRW